MFSANKCQHFHSLTIGKQLATVITVGKQFPTAITVGKQFATVKTVGKQFTTVIETKYFTKYTRPSREETLMFDY